MPDYTRTDTFINGNGKDPVEEASRGDQLSRHFDTDVNRFAGEEMNAVNYPLAIRGSADIDRDVAANLKRPARANPYDLGLGNQAREGFLAALDQLHNGTSVVNGQAAQAMGQLGSQVGRATANTSSGLAQALAVGAGAQGASAVANQAGDARLSEFMGQQRQYAGGVNALRGQDLRQAGDFQESGLKQRGQDDALHNFYTQLGMKSANAQDQAYIRQQAVKDQLKRNKDESNWANGKQDVTTAASVIKMIAGGG